MLRSQLLWLTSCVTLTTVFASQPISDSLETHGFGDSTTMKPNEELTTTSKYNFNALCPHCSLQLSLDSLEEVEYNLSMLHRSINLIIEDEYNHGEFYFVSGNHILKYISGEPIRHVLGPSLDNEFGQLYVAEVFGGYINIITGLVQLTETTFLFSYYTDGCVFHFDMVTKGLTEFIGNCDSRYENVKQTQIQPGEELPADANFLLNPYKLVMIKSKNYLIVTDFGYDQLYRYDFENKTVRILGDDLYQSLPYCEDILPTRDESAIYVAHSYGLSRVDLNTFEVTLITGEVYSGPDNAPDIVFSPGSFDTAVIGHITAIHWLVPDRLMVAIGSFKNEELIFIDLEGKKFIQHALVLRQTSRQ